MNLIRKVAGRATAHVFISALISIVLITILSGCSTDINEEQERAERSEAFKRLIEEVRSEQERAERSDAFESLIAELEEEGPPEEEVKVELKDLDEIEVEPIISEEKNASVEHEEVEIVEEIEIDKNNMNTETEELEVAEVEEEAEEVIEEENIQKEAENAELNILNGNMNILSGLKISEGVHNGRPLAVMVQNAPGARPQSGLIHADIVFETVVEHGITRFLALFSSYEAEIIGPVRSARIYYAELARSFDPIYTFWGTYDDAYGVINNMNMDLLDAHSNSHVPYTGAGWRDHSRSDTLWHTAFINTSGIKTDGESVGYSLQGGQSAMKFKQDAKENERGDAESVTVDFSSENYKASFNYDINSNKYLRSMAGEPHIDHETGEQISVNNVVILVTDIDGPVNRIGHMKVRTTGDHSQGKAYYLIDGNVISGTWGRDSIQDPFEFLDTEGDPILFNQGSTWVALIESIEKVKGLK